VNLAANPSKIKSWDERRAAATAKNSGVSTAKEAKVSIGAGELFPGIPFPAQASASKDEVTVEFTIMTGSASMTKTFGVDAEGAPIQTAAAGVPPRATARRVKLQGDSARIGNDFADVLRTLTADQAFVLGRPPSGKDEWPVVPHRDLAEHPDAIAKTADNFKAAAGPSLLGLDHDIKLWPALIIDKIREFDDLTGALASVCPALGTSMFVSRSSSSAGISNVRTGKATGRNAGQHRYYVARDGADLIGENGFAARLRDRLVLAGFGFGLITAAGTVLVKTLIDAGASTDFSRYWYEASAVLAHRDLQHDVSAREPTIKNEGGGLLDTTSLPALTSEERKRLDQIENQVRTEMAPQAAIVRERWKANREKALIAGGVPASRAAKIVGHAVETHELVGDFPIPLDSGGAVTVDEILDDRARYHGQTCADPMEPEYGNGRNKGIIYTDSNPPRIFSHAHGGLHYLLKRSPAYWFEEHAGPDNETPGAEEPEEGAGLLTDPETSAVARLNKTHAAVLSGGRTIVLTEKHANVSFGTVEMLRAWYANDTVRVDKKDMPVIDAWLQSRRRRQYDQIVFAPEGAPTGSYNLWRGFSVEPDPAARCDRFLEHLHQNVCCGDDEHFKWVQAFFAQMVQQPGDKPGVALALRGGQGTGKTLVGRYVGGLFPAHHVVVSQPDHLTGRFNSHLERALLIQAEEAFWAGDRAAAGGALKDLITSERMRIERKGIDTIEVRNNARLLITTNSRWAVPAGLDERRFAVFDVADTRKQDSQYFGALVGEMERGGRAALLHHLQTFDLACVDLRKVPDTEALLDQKLATLPPLERWWLSKLQEGRFNFAEQWASEISTSEMYDSYEHGTQKIGRPIGDAEFGREMRRLCPGIKKSRPRIGQSRVHVFTLPSLEECRAAFSELIGARLDWDAQ